MAGGEIVIVAGLGCRKDCPADEIVALVREAEARAGCRVGELAAPAFKREEAGLRGAAALLALPLTLVGNTALADAQPRCVTRSEAEMRATGLASVAEAAAIAASGGPLLLPRISARRATCAVAGR